MPVTVSDTRSPKPYCFSVMMKKPANRSCTMRCAPKPSAAPSTAAGATSEPTGIARMSVISTATIDEQQRHRHPRDHRCDGLAVLGALGAHQLVAFPVFGVDAADDPVGGPVDEPGGQQTADHQQGDPHAAVENPDADVAAPETTPAIGQIQCKYGAIRHLLYCANGFRPPGIRRCLRPVPPRDFRLRIRCAGP